MALGGEYYDKANNDFTPNKDRRMAEWRKKKKTENTEYLQRKHEMMMGRDEPHKYETPRSKVFHESHGKEDQIPTTLFDLDGNPNF